MRLATAIAAALLAVESFAGFRSRFVPTGDFPKTDWTESTHGLVPDLTNKYALVAMSASVGEVLNGMRMDFGENPVEGTPLSAYAPLIASAKTNGLDRTMLEGAMFKKTILTLRDLLRTNWSYDYGDVFVLGVSTNMNLVLSPSSAASVCADLALSLKSNMQTINGIDIALFRDVGVTPVWASPIGSNVASAYFRVFGATVPIGSYYEEDMENAVKSYDFTEWLPGIGDASVSAYQCGFWKEGRVDSSLSPMPEYAYRQLFYSPFTWFNSAWSPQHMGMVFSFDSQCVPVETRVRRRVSEAVVRITRTVASDTVTFDLVVGDIVSYTQESVFTNLVSCSSAKLKGSIIVIGDDEVEIPVTYANHNYDYNPPRMLVSGDPYQVTTNGATYWCQKMHAMPCAWTNTADHLDIPVSYVVVTTNQRFVATAPGADAFPGEWGQFRSQMLGRVVANGWKFNDDAVSVDCKKVITNDGDAEGMKRRIALKLVPTLREQVGTNTFDIVWERHDYDVEYDEYESWFDMSRLSPGESGYPFDEDEVYVYTNKVGETLVGYLGHTKDFVHFTTDHLFAPSTTYNWLPVNDVPPYHYGEHAYGSQSWKMDIDVKIAVFGFWKFCQWAHE